MSSFGRIIREEPPMGEAARAAVDLDCDRPRTSEESAPPDAPPSVVLPTVVAETKHQPAGTDRDEPGRLPERCEYAVAQKRRGEARVQGEPHLSPDA
jgi:hypothetical protein